MNVDRKDFDIPDLAGMSSPEINAVLAEVFSTHSERRLLSLRATLDSNLEELGLDSQVL